MKTLEELFAIKNEYKAMFAKLIAIREEYKTLLADLSDLTEDELHQVVGGSAVPEPEDDSMTKVLELFVPPKKDS